MRNPLVKKTYFCKNGDDLDTALVLLHMPEFALSVKSEVVKTDPQYSEVTVLCLERQLMGVLHLLENIEG